ncbi:MAG TPA: crotonase/enoyl-CoA hydratase family protein [Rhodocyclaceae bacterium]
MKFESIGVQTECAVATIALNRAARANALDATLWRELSAVFDWLDGSEARAAVLCGAGEHFCAGIDLAFLQAVQQQVAALPVAERVPSLEALIRDLQRATGAAERCRKPVIAAVHGACFGGGVDLIATCDLRFATRDARFSVKEVDLAIVADLGSLQRLPRLVGEGMARELAFTGREFDGEEAVRIGLANEALADREALMEHAQSVARAIAAKSPATVRGIKAAFNYNHSHTVEEGLEHIARHNARALFSSDLYEAMAARQEKRAPKFKD